MNLPPWVITPVGYYWVWERPYYYYWGGWGGVRRVFRGADCSGLG